ncbi:MAG: O-antigen ligase family protein [Fimbriimonadaceae bacterium]|nr:O-antigen ligase family protein [Fimbriimonadaceae bacterium]
MKGLRPEAVALALAAFLAPVIGGQVSQEPTPLSQNLLAEVLGGPALPLMARALLGVLVLGALAYTLVKRQVLPVPPVSMVLALFALVGLLGLSSAMSSFAAVGLSTWWSWMLYAGAFGLTVTCVGRERGTTLVLGAVVAGCAVVGYKGVVEYLAEAATNPTWRVFAGWNNPNGVASLVVGGALLAIGLGSSLKGPLRWASWIGGALAVATLWFTQSKGGLGALAVGLLGLVAMAFVVKRPKPLALGTAVTLALAAVIAVGGPALARSARPNLAVGAQAAPRVFQASATQVQSEDFRKNLWKSAVQIAVTHPTGVGAGNFRFYSAQPGLSDQTVFAHQTFLQIAAEGTWLALAAFVLFLVQWFAKALPTHGTEPDSRRVLKAAVVAAVLAWCAHGFFESNVYYLGLGLTFFIVLGVGVQLADDLSSPEWSPSWVRVAVAVACCLVPMVAMVLAGQQEVAKASFVSALGTPELADAAERLKSVNDPEATYLLGIYGSRTAEERLERLTEAAKKYPRTKVLRALARTQAQAGKPAAAVSSLRLALTYDPNGLPTLAELMRTYDQMGDKESAAATARQLIEVEQKPSYLVRAIPEIVPTETFEARVYLAGHTQDKAEKARLLGEATEGYKRFVATTVPGVIATGNLGGIDIDRAVEIVQSGQAANAQYAQALKDAGQTEKAAQADQDGQGFVEALASLSKPR